MGYAGVEPARGKSPRGLKPRVSTSSTNSPKLKIALSGFEPELVEPESTVLSLDHKAITVSRYVSLSEMSIDLTEIDFTESNYFNYFIRKVTTYTNDGNRTRFLSTLLGGILPLNYVDRFRTIWFSHLYFAHSI